MPLISLSRKASQGFLLPFPEWSSLLRFRRSFKESLRSWIDYRHDAFLDAAINRSAPPSPRYPSSGKPDTDFSVFPYCSLSGCPILCLGRKVLSPVCGNARFFCQTSLPVGVKRASGAFFL